MRFLAVLLFLCVSSFAGFFLDEPKVENARSAGKVPPLRFGAAVDVAVYLSSVDLGLDFSAEYRLHENHSLDVFATALLGGEMYEAGLGWRVFPGADLEKSGHEDFLRFSLSTTYFEVDGESFYPLRVSVGYGRDFLFLNNADFLCRMEVRGSYLINEAYSEDSGDGLFRETTHFIFNLSFGVFLF